jgi:hypothetical protein
VAAKTSLRLRNCLRNCLRLLVVRLLRLAPRTGVRLPQINMINMINMISRLLLVSGKRISDRNWRHFCVRSCLRLRTLRLSLLVLRSCLRVLRSCLRLRLSLRALRHLRL